MLFSQVSTVSLFANEFYLAEGALIQHTLASYLLRVLHTQMSCEVVDGYAAKIADGVLMNSFLC